LKSKHYISIISGRQTLLPDTTNIIAIRLGVVVRVAMIQVRVPGIRSRILSSRPAYCYRL